MPENIVFWDEFDYAFTRGDIERARAEDDEEDPDWPARHRRQIATVQVRGEWL